MCASAMHCPSACASAARRRIGFAPHEARSAVKCAAARPALRCTPSSKSSSSSELLGSPGLHCCNPTTWRLAPVRAATFLRALGPEPWRAAYVQPRAVEGWPLRRQSQPDAALLPIQVVLRRRRRIFSTPAGSLEALGLDLRHNDVRSSRTIGRIDAGRLGPGWEVWLNGMNPQFAPTVGGIGAIRSPARSRTRIERLAMYLQQRSLFDLVWTEWTKTGARRGSRTATSIIRTRSSSRPTTSSSRTRRNCSSCSRFRIRREASARARLPLPGYEMILRRRMRSTSSMRAARSR